MTDTLVPSVLQRFADTICAEDSTIVRALARHAHRPELPCYDLLSYVEHLSTCLGGIVRTRVTQTRPMDVSNMSITAENRRKMIVYLNYKHFQVSRCVGTSRVYERTPKISTVPAR